MWFFALRPLARGCRPRFVAPSFPVVIILNILAACGDTGAPRPSPSAIVVVGGDGQSASVESQLAQPVIFQVVDAEQRPVAGVAIEAHAGGDGLAAVDRSVSGTDGRVSVRWTLGSTAGAQELDLSAGSLSAHASATGLSCDGPACEPPPSGPIPLTPIGFSTYDGSGQVVHPDVIWNQPGRGFWLTITPYPFGNATYENPSFFQSRGGAAWQVPNGVLNPIAKPSTGYYSDPDLVRDPASGKLRIYFRQVLGGDNVVLLTTSANGTDWTPPTEVARAASHRLVSPAVVAGAPGAAWQMWSVNAGTAGCTATATTVERRRSNDGITWGPPETVGLEHAGGVIWHLDVQWIAERREYWALYTVYGSGGSCVTPELHLATSKDGITWYDRVTPVLTRGALPAFQDVVYRSTLVYDEAAHLVRFWYSGAAYHDGRYVWAAATEARPIEELAASPTVRAALAPIPIPPERELPPPEPGDMPVDAP